MIQLEDERLSSSTKQLQKKFNDDLMDIMCLLLLPTYVPGFKRFLCSQAMRHCVSEEERLLIPKASRKELQEMFVNKFQWFNSTLFDVLPKHVPERIKDDVMPKLTAMQQMVNEYFNGTGRLIIYPSQILIVFDSAYDDIPASQFDDLYKIALEATGFECDVGHCDVAEAMIIRMKMYDKPIQESLQDSDYEEELCTLKQGHRIKRKLNNTKTVTDTSSYTDMKHFVSQAEP